MKVQLPFSCFCILFLFFASCNNGSENNQTMHNNGLIDKELAKIDSLLQDSAFAEKMARELDAAYYKGIGETAPPFLAPGEDTLQLVKSVAEEKIATNVAGFYALECGLNYLCEKYNSTPIDWLEKITAKTTGDSVVLILNRFANATWKAGQPFRGLSRIKRPNFIGSYSLSDAEVEKDYRQIVAAATKLKTSMQPGTLQEQMQQLRILLHDKEYALSMAAYMDSLYYVGENLLPKPFIKGAEAKAVKNKSFREEKIATNLAGFYAVECGVNYLVTTRSQLPTTLLRSIIDNSISREDKLLLTRFANATWKAGQPFRGLDRITRDTFTPFYFLTEADIEKDWVQVKAAAATLLAAL